MIVMILYPLRRAASGSLETVERSCFLLAAVAND